MKTVQDHYFKKAKKEGYAARSAYKLKEIDQKHGLLKKGFRVLDLGCFPGSWLQYISKRIGAEGRVIGIDQTALRIPLQANMGFIHSDINDIDPQARQELKADFDLVCSDMAPDSTGIRNVDSERSYHLCQMALNMADLRLKTNGSLLVKSFQGPAFDRLVKQMRTAYRKVNIIKPKSSRNESREIFLLGVQKRKIIE